MLVVGLTGGYASGKSTVAAMFKELGAEIVDADILARKVVEPGKPAWQKLVERFGREILLEDETINRPAIAEIIFNSPEDRKAVNAIVHPRVMEEEQKAIYDIRKRRQNPLVVINVPLLIESGHYKICDKVVVVRVDDDIHIRRLVERDGFSWEEAVKRISAQMPLSEKVKYADFVINNNGTLDETRDAVKKIFYKLKEEKDWSLSGDW